MAEVPLVTSLTFVAPTGGGSYFIYAWVDSGWRLYDHSEDIDDAMRKARKYNFRLTRLMESRRDKGQAVER